VTKPELSIRDCAQITISLARSAQNVRELRDRIAEVPIQSILHHFFETQLRPSFDDPEFSNDFARWAGRSLRDPVLAERLGIVDALQYDDSEGLRLHLLDVLEERLSEIFHIPSVAPGHEFQFLRSQLVVFSTDRRAATPDELAALVPRLSTGSLFYHFVEARRRNPGRHDDFTLWLRAWPEPWPSFAERLERIGVHHRSLTEIRAHVAAALAAGPVPRAVKAASPLPAEPVREAR
jgi:uncharacterized protein DUF5752